jgi:RimJ/RimL family protein N-acetyltransferase
MWADPTDLQTAFADGFPQELEDFMQRVHDNAHPFWIYLYGQEPLGAFWLHDLVYNEKGRWSGGWIGGHIIPAARKRYGWALCDVTLTILDTIDLPHVFAAVHVQNRRSQAYVTRGLRFTRVALYPRFTLFGGQPTDVVLYSWRRDDHTVAWKEAHQRAIRNRATWDDRTVQEQERWPNFPERRLQRTGRKGQNVQSQDLLPVCPGSYPTQAPALGASVKATARH